MKRQVNIELQELFARRIKADAAIMGVTLNEYARIAFEHFIRKSISSRRVYFDGVKRKTVGRKSLIPVEKIQTV